MRNLSLEKEIKPYVSCQDGHLFYPQIKRPAGNAKLLLAITIFFKEIFSTFDEFIFHKYASISLQNFHKNSTWYFSIAILHCCFGRVWQCAHEADKELIKKISK